MLDEMFFAKNDLRNFAACDITYMLFSVKNVLIKVGRMKVLVQVDMEFAVYVRTFTNFVKFKISIPT